MSFSRVLSVGLLLAMLVLSGCSSIMEMLPVGQGPGPDELKKSPCACVELPQAPIPSAWLVHQST